jgi:hypothetical protein
MKYINRLALLITFLVAILTPSFGKGGHGGHHHVTSSDPKVYAHERAYHQAHRSRAARAEFMRQHPCPATGKGYGACPGYVVDHVKPLACGGADAPANMQWQTVAEGKAKDAWERKGPGCH